MTLSRDVSVPLDMINVRIAAALCFLAVALGAFGAHSLKQTLETHGMLDVWNKAVLYHFIHALALLVLAPFSVSRIAAHGGYSLRYLHFLVAVCMRCVDKSSHGLERLRPIGGSPVSFAGWAWLVNRAAGVR